AHGGRRRPRGGGEGRRRQGGGRPRGLTAAGGASTACPRPGPAPSRSRAPPVKFRPALGHREDNREKFVYRTLRGDTPASRPNPEGDHAPTPRTPECPDVLGDLPAPRTAGPGARGGRRPRGRARGARRGPPGSAAAGAGEGTGVVPARGAGHLAQLP